MQRVLVTGSQGLLGQYLVRYLRGRGHEVICHARSGHADVQADLSDCRAGRAVLDAVSPQLIVNLVALADVDECERNPDRAYFGNVRTVETLADWMRRAKRGSHLIQISTDQVYDGPGPHAEHDVVLKNYYAFSKYAGELVAESVPSTIIRTNFFGPSAHSRRTSLSDWLVRALSHSDPITVFEDVYFSPLTLQTLVVQLDKIAREPICGTFNLGSRDGMSKADFAFVVAEVLGLPTTAVSRGRSDRAGLLAYRPKDMRMDSSRYEHAFDVQLPTLRQEIESMRMGYAKQAD